MTIGRFAVLSFIVCSILTPFAMGYDLGSPLVAYCRGTFIAAAASVVGSAFAYYIPPKDRASVASYSWAWLASIIFVALIAWGYRVS